MPETDDALDVEDRVYRMLVTAGPVSREHVAAEVGISAEASRQALAALVERGLAAPADRRAARFTASQPDVEFMLRLRQQAEALDRARDIVGDLLRTVPGTARPDGRRPAIEAVTGARAVRGRLAELQSEVFHEVVWFCASPELLADGGTFNPDVRHRVLCARTALPGGATPTDTAHINGSVRLVHHVPMELAIADRSVGLCRLSPAEGDDALREPAAVVVRDAGVLDALLLLFETQWDVSLPPRPVAPPPLGEADRRLLALLAGGATDRTAARHMGVSQRTLQRHVGRLMALAGASTRMQLGWQAARREWLR
ncbi:hypothetical protein [Actinacidiphila glaucinigra]|uniref:hypothetical protein n=1 Tax=Actinacidiphila glaucinigra TaxID=235986 RepID=UPI00366CE82A